MQWWLDHLQKPQRKNNNVLTTNPPGVKSLKKSIQQGPKDQEPSVQTSTKLHNEAELCS